MLKIKESGRERYSPVVNKSELTPRKSSLIPNPQIDFYDGKMDPYELKLKVSAVNYLIIIIRPSIQVKTFFFKDMKFKPFRGPTIEELSNTIPKVTLETFQC